MWCTMIFKNFEGRNIVSPVKKMADKTTDGATCML